MVSRSLLVYIENGIVLEFSIVLSRVAHSACTGVSTKRVGLRIGNTDSIVRHTHVHLRGLMHPSSPQGEADGSLGLADRRTSFFLTLRRFPFGPFSLQSHHRDRFSSVQYGSRDGHHAPTI